MTLSFSQKYKDGTPNNFVAKIWSGLTQNIAANQIGEEVYEYGADFYDLNASPKIHTIRRDSKNRWKTGNKIHFIINNRTADRFQFAPVVLVKEVQKIRIQIENNEGWNHYRVIIDSKLMYSTHLHEKCFWGYDDLKAFVMNDGFESIEQFFQWFSEDFDGKIIHWTDKKY